MTIRPVLVAPDPRLKVRAEPVATVTDEIRTLMDDMLETMYQANGIGLAATQIGEPHRVLVLDLGAGNPAEKPEDWPEDQTFFPSRPLKIANPEITWYSDSTMVYQEGCLSVPGFYDDVERPDAIKLTYLDYDNNQQTLEAEGLLAICIQHEIDHLNGKLFIDHLSQLKRNRTLSGLRKAKKSGRLNTKYPVVL